jgi:hypothetical protein
LPRLWEQFIPLEREGYCWVEQAIVLSITASYTPVALSAVLKVFGHYVTSQAGYINPYISSLFK